MSRTVAEILEDPFAEYEELTDRQREVLRLSAEGYEIAEIARILDVSVRTINYDRKAGCEVVRIRPRDLTWLVYRWLRNATN